MCLRWSLLCVACSFWCSLEDNYIDDADAAAAVRALMRAVTGRRLDEFVSGIGATKEEEVREVSS
jgi:hypothetical protein